MVTCCNHGCGANGAAVWEGGDYLLDISCSTALQDLCQGDASWQQGAALDDAVIHSPTDKMTPAAEPATLPGMQTSCIHSAELQQGAALYAVIHSPAYRVPLAAEPATHPDVPTPCTHNAELQLACSHVAQDCDATKVLIADHNCKGCVKPLTTVA